VPHSLSDRRRNAGGFAEADHRMNFCGLKSSTAR